MPINRKRITSGKRKNKRRDKRFYKIARNILSREQLIKTAKKLGRV